MDSEHRGQESVSGASPHLAAGSELGPYRLEEMLGAGGMGDVYRAFDTRLHRTVAIKVLRPDKSLDPERRRRFLQEARAASALNHPNIVTLHDLARDGEIDFLVMELVAGQPLSRAIPRKGLSLADAIAYATQIVSALAAAHEKNLVHRDIKPANVMVTTEGQVKVLDFGLAKLGEPAGARSEAETRTVLTEAGMVMGTMAYMSPEQARGENVDARTDLFAFGTVLHEMATGRRAFPKPLDWTLPPQPGVDPELDRIILKLIEPDQEVRYQTAKDVAADLRRLQRAGESKGAPSRTWLVAGAAAVLAIAGTVVVAWLRNPAPSTAPPSLLVQLTKDGGYTGYPSLSPDGRLIAYLSDRTTPGKLDLWVQQTDGSGAVQLTREYAFHDPPTEITPPAFSPDGTRILFAGIHESDGSYGVYEVPALGGDPRLVVNGGYSPRYSPDGKWISYGRAQMNRPLSFVIPSVGGEPRQILPDFASVEPPVWSPDNRLLAAGSRGARDPTCFWVAAAEGGSAATAGFCRDMAATGLKSIRVAAWTFRNEIIFTASRGDTSNLWRAQLMPAASGLEAMPAQLTSGTGVEGWPSVSGRRMAFSSASTVVDLAAVPLDANRAVPRGPLEMLTRDAANDYSVSISRDGAKLAYASDLRGNSDVYVRDLRSGRTAVLAGTSENESRPFISPDGAEVVYSVNRKLFVVPLAGGNPRLVCTDCGIPRGWSRDRSTLLLWNYEQAKQTVNALDLSAGKSTEVLRDDTLGIMHPTLSPDDAWVAFFVFHSADSFQVFVAPWRPGGQVQRSEWIPITPLKARNVAPAWSPDGNLLYFDSVIGNEEQEFAQRLDPGTRRPAGSPTHVVFEMGPREHLRNWAESTIQFAADRMVFTTQQETSNIWLMNLPERR